LAHPPGKRGLSCCFILVISWEQRNGQYPSLATRAPQNLDKTRHFSHDQRHTSDLTRSHADLVVENALLRQQLIVLNRQFKRPQLTNPERFRLVFLSHFTTFWKQALHIVQPDTLLRWHRELFQFYWRKKSQGKPKISAEMIVLIKKMAKENRLWGAERIRGELMKLGLEVSKRTIQRYMLKDRQAPSSSHIVPMLLRETWATFLKNQASGIWACDFTVVNDWLFRQWMSLW
jgi:putative transposase